MPTFNAADLMSRQRHMSAYGDLIGIGFSLNVPNTWANADIFRMGILQAGLEVLAIGYACPALCASGGNAVFGFTPVNAADGPAANNNYFSGGATLTAPFAAIQNGAWLMRFQPLKLEFDVFLDILINSAVTTPATGLLSVNVLGRAVGVR